MDQRAPVTVVVATRDRPELLRKTLDSVAAQDYLGVVETVVVYDRSEPDETLAVHGGDRPVRVITNTRRPGLQGARNTGMEATDGALIAFCDDDDIWRPGKLSAQVDLLDAHPGIDFATTGIEIRYGDIRRPRPAGHRRVERSDLLRSRTIEASHPSTFLFRRGLLDRMGLIDEDVPGGYGEDYEFLLRATRYTDVIAVNDPEVEILWHQQSFYVERWQMRIDGLSYVLDQHPDIADDRRGLARIRGQIAFARAALGDYSQARKEAVSTLRLAPTEHRAWLSLLIATRLVSADRVVQWVQKTGRSI
ncbi:MAG: glycosyltransferase family 2 protein [Acidimicrobiales bacterium]